MTLSFRTKAAAGALAAGLASTALLAPVADASDARIVSLKISPTKVHTGKSATVTWDLTKGATTVFQVARCLNSTCTTRIAVGDPIKRHASAGLNTLKLRLRVRPARYALVVRAGRSDRKVLVRVVP